MKNLSWHLNLNINNIRNLFFDIDVLPYEVDCYFCSCGNKDIIIKNQNSDIDKYKCSICDNEDFYDSDKYLNNYTWYEPISTLFDEEYLSLLEPKITFDQENKILKANIFLDIPSSYDLASDEIIYHSRNLFELELGLKKNIKQILLANYDLDSLVDEDIRYWDNVSEEELINKSLLLRGFKKNILNEFKKYSNYFDSKIASKTNTLEEFSFFINNNHLLDLDFYKWININLLPKDKKLSVLDALDIIGNNRTEKTLKKNIINNYKRQLHELDNYWAIFIYSISRCIDDVNILNKMIDIDLESHLFEIVNPNDLYLFIKYLSGKFTAKQIERLFISYCENEMFWLSHTINLFSEIYDYIDDFKPTKCRFDLLHDDIVNYHRIILNKKLFQIEFHYDEKFLKACININNYEIRLPKNGVQLYQWSNVLQNCLSGYWRLIKEKQTIVYGFYENNEIKFAVEIKNNKIVQSKSKYNQDLQHKEMNLVKGWFKEYFEENLN